jgi:hypothetical protein
MEVTSCLVFRYVIGGSHTPVINRRPLSVGSGCRRRLRCAKQRVLAITDSPNSTDVRASQNGHVRKCFLAIRADGGLLLGRKARSDHDEVRERVIELKRQNPGEAP